ncbi:glycosyl transferase family protein [Pseudomonadota bacterium]
MSTELHPFSQYIRILGRGKKGARALSQDEAYDAMGMILDGHIEPEQLGAFLMLVRVKEETPEEVAGFVRAVRERTTLPGALPSVDVDWSSYAGKRRHLPWFILSVLALVDSGIKVFMHGMQGRKDDRLYTPDVLKELGIPMSSSLSDAVQQIETEGFAYLGLDTLFPRLQQLINLRDLLGLRSPVHTVSRMLNPFDAPCQMQGIFHPGYLDIHQGAAALLNQPRMAVIKGDGGEIECNPDSELPIYTVRCSEQRKETWPAMFSKRHTKPATLDVAMLKEVWRGANSDEYGTAAVISTMAVTLYTMGKAGSKDEAFEEARSLWSKRSKDLV